VLVHTTNTQAGDRIVDLLSKSHWPVGRVVPYGDLDWVSEAWFRSARNLIVKHVPTPLTSAPAAAKVEGVGSPSSGETRRTVRAPLPPGKGMKPAAKGSAGSATKVRPTGFRVGMVEDWRSRWYSPAKEFGALLVEDHKIRKLIREEYEQAAIEKVEI
jgi:hypothetical protein